MPRSSPRPPIRRPARGAPIAGAVLGAILALGFHGVAAAQTYSVARPAPLLPQLPGAPPPPPVYVAQAAPIVDNPYTPHETEKPFYYPSRVLGGFGVTDPFTGHETEPDVTAEVQFQPFGHPDWFFFFRPRPHIGVNGNLGGKTSLLYAGFTWDVFRFREVYFDLAFGAAIHNGILNRDPKMSNRKLLGSREEFNERVEVGYDLTERVALSVYIDHFSNAGWLANKNQGLESSGVRGVWKF